MLRLAVEEDVVFLGEWWHVWVDVTLVIQSVTKFLMHVFKQMLGPDS